MLYAIEKILFYVLLKTKISKERQIMIKKIFTRKLAVYLREHNFKIIGTEVNFKHPEYDVWLFEDTPELRKAMDNYRNQ